ncbi:THO complex subunit 7 homolog [Strongylocentrotus purpuratus]|uniref:THO complex subunit 7 homolog n=1 Tax=Strongylocentrotus purpuratus TaxID=7668 RepID=A0A7M7MZX3_STRPU|nr:THO complex subunit 7 homolog [Strongylocentrotus purpuratus]|eukprot:XP_791518.3 PREDICTED: THO complex subunit 7 homolog [Strongylocentrotus purpuratus]
MMATDEEVIRKRLLIEGESGGDDRRISNLLKTFVKWCHTDQTKEECTVTYQKMLMMLCQVDFATERTQLIHQMNIREMSNYEELYSTIEHNIKDAHQQINACKTELSDAKRERKNRQEYDTLAKVIQKQPDRKETLNKLQELDKDLGELNSTKESLEQKLEDRKKQFHVLISAIHELQRILDTDDGPQKLNTTSDSMMSESMDTSLTDK